MTRSALLTTVAILATVIAAPASAQTVCGDRAKMISYLGTDYKESRTGMGIAANGSVVELYTADTGSWTMLMTVPGGPTCVMGSGEAWENQLKPAPVAGELS
jgi:hypothetical protein